MTRILERCFKMENNIVHLQFYHSEVGLKGMRRDFRAYEVDTT